MFPNPFLYKIANAKPCFHGKFRKGCNVQNASSLLSTMQAAKVMPNLNGLCVYLPEFYVSHEFEMPTGVTSSLHLEQIYVIGNMNWIKINSAVGLRNAMKIDGQKSTILLMVMIFLGFLLLVGAASFVWWCIILGLAFVVMRQGDILAVRPGQSGREFSLLPRHLGLVAIALGCLMVLLDPQIDADVSRIYYQNEKWVLGEFATFVSHNISRSLFYIGVLGAIVCTALWPFLKSTVYNRITATFVMFALAQVLLMLGVVHEILKPLFARSRPRHIEDQLAQGYAEPWWQIGEFCTRNCSMPSGEASAAFACLAAALAWNRGAFWPSMRFTLVFGAVMGWIRIGGGAHFASDVVMSAVFMLPLSWLLWIGASRAWNARPGLLR